MNRAMRQTILTLVLTMLLLPSVGSAAGMGADTPLNQPEQSVNDATSATIPIVPNVPDIKYHEAGAPPEEAGGAAASPASKEQIKVIYDTETEKDRGKMIALVIAFGISLGLNIYLGTALVSARRRF